MSEALFTYLNKDMLLLNDALWCNNEVSLNMSCLLWMKHNTYNTD